MFCLQDDFFNSNGRADSFLTYFVDAGIKFDVFIRFFEEMLLWVAALDHIHYLRWRLVFLNDIVRLPDSIKEAFNQENFTVNKTSRAFSAMGIDQAHEQKNRSVKVDGGAIGIMDNESSLLEWELSGP